MAGLDGLQNLQQASHLYLQKTIPRAESRMQSQSKLAEIADFILQPMVRAMLV